MIKNQLKGSILLAVCALFSLSMQTSWAEKSYSSGELEIISIKSVTSNGQTIIRPCANKFLQDCTINLNIEFPDACGYITVSNNSGSTATFSTTAGESLVDETPCTASSRGSCTISLCPKPMAPQTNGKQVFIKIDNRQTTVSFILNIQGVSFSLHLKQFYLNNRL
ncbi:hypothetical protein EP47_11795 [Legionella norrlandica]|uniref:Uncharacterized protein n=1 Tax=Legionella norrlandica TaxID=1498499 RepID=A0A0A2SXK0_9GAMM|nr:hypothetical protein [Legionella norrlandica]KGP64441.1 hypothetical protein EP47_11795 [Legionella norrlandica]